MMQPQPRLHGGAEPCWQTGHVAEVGDMQFAARRKSPHRLGHDRAPLRDHRHGVGDKDALVAVAAEGRARVECRGVGAGQPYSTAQSGGRNRVTGGGKHLARNVDAVEMSLGIAPGRLHQIAAGAAADLQHRGTGRRCERGDHRIAAEQIIFARGVVDAEPPLVAVDAVHQQRVVGTCIHGVHPRRTWRWNPP